MIQVSFASTQNESQTELWVSAKSHPETSMVPAALLLHTHPAWLSTRHGHAGGSQDSWYPRLDIPSFLLGRCLEVELFCPGAPETVKLGSVGPFC